MINLQNRLYLCEFGIRYEIDGTNRRPLRAIGGRSVEIGTETVQTTFSGLGILIEVISHILDDSVPSLLSTTNMLENYLDIRIQDKVVKQKERTNHLNFENLILIHR